MSSPDFHQVLGVAPDATLAEIKRAYKRLAMRWHPDRNADPQAQDQFRLVREAFERLTRPTEADDAPEADTPTPEPTPEPKAAEPKAAEPKTAEPTPRGEDRYQDLELDLAEAARGATVTVTVDGREDCTDCGGTGQRSYGRTSMCAHCLGSGRKRVGGKLETCGHCHGKGFTTDTHCPTCEGRGWLPAERQLAVSVPPAMLPGEELRVAGQGGPAPDGGNAGDLYLVLRTRPHPIFELHGRDIRVTVPVSVFRVLAGGPVEVPTLGGVREVLISEAAPSAEIRVAGAGFPARGKRKAGDLLVKLDTQPILFIGKEQKAMLELAEQMLQNNLAAQSPTLERWQATLDSYR